MLDPEDINFYLSAFNGLTPKDITGLARVQVKPHPYSRGRLLIINY
jgi:hypothetical protein